MEINWQPLGKVYPAKASDEQFSQAGQGPKIWMLVWSFGGQQVACIGQTGGYRELFGTSGRLENSTFNAASRKWGEFFRVSLTRRAGFAELYVRDASEEEAERKNQRKILIRKESDTGKIIVGDALKADWPTWLKLYYSSSVLSAMSDYKKGGRILEKSHQRLFERLTTILASLPETSPSDDAGNDLDGDMPTKTPFSGMRYSRDPLVRQNVKKRAKGRCELCCVEGFLQLDGSHYVECHHIIALAKDGEDRASNVIALCPGHHREAHFGHKKAELEEQMIQVLQLLGLR